MSKKSSYPKDPSHQHHMAASAPPGPNMGPPPAYTPYPTQPYAYAAGVPGPAQPYPQANPNMMVMSPGYPNYGKFFAQVAIKTMHLGGVHLSNRALRRQPQQAGYAPPANPGYPVQQGFNYAQPPALAVAQFDSGARFDGVATQNIPPPPPGYAPNAAQIASAHGGTVVASQNQASWLSGGTGGGVSFW